MLWSRENLSFEYSGYHSVAVNPPLTVRAGNDLNVIVHVRNSASWLTLPIDNLGPAVANQSFASATGANGSWFDLGATQHFDVGIRLRISNCAAPPTATASPTKTKTPTRTRTPTATRTVRPSPSATRGTLSHRSHLPLILKALPQVAPTPTMTVMQAPTATATTTSGWVTIMSEGFEGDFPGNGWGLADESASDSGEFLWGQDDYKPHSGGHSAWPAAAGADGLDPQLWYYPHNMNTIMVYGPFDLRGATAAELAFSYWSKTEAGYDELHFGAMSEWAGSDGGSISGDSEGWRDVSFDLERWVGHSNVLIGFRFTSDESVWDDGIFVDDIVLRKHVGQ